MNWIGGFMVVLALLAAGCMANSTNTYGAYGAKTYEITCPENVLSRGLCMSEADKLCPSGYTEFRKSGEVKGGERRIIVQCKGDYSQEMPGGRFIVN